MPGSDLLKICAGGQRKSGNDTTFELNEKFAYDKKDVLDLGADQEESLDIKEEKLVELAVNLDRRAHVESNLYKMMKQQKQMRRADLLNVVHAGLKFPQPLGKVEESLKTLLLRGLLEEITVTGEENEDQMMQGEQDVYIRFAN